MPSLTRIVAAVEEEEEVDEMDGEMRLSLWFENEVGVLLLIASRFCVVGVLTCGDFSALNFDVTVASIGTVPGTFC